ncbi:MAG: hypothetical protein IJU45_06900 [Clostridia bacterium]|nr:hypothetical protein [Clostridia bacterium]
MIVAVCVDDNMGMLFFGKRQSRDKVVLNNLIMSAGKNKVYIKSFSAKVFEGRNVIVDDNCLENAGEKDYCFIENTDIVPYASKIRKIILYKWNRDYPCDFKFKMPEGFRLSKTSDFTGKSHDKITREEYVR